jgi:hypothetical protein
MTKVVGVTAEHQQNLMDSQVVRCRIVGSYLVTDLGDGSLISRGPRGALISHVSRGPGCALHPLDVSDGNHGSIA